MNVCNVTRPSVNCRIWKYISALIPTRDRSCVPNVRNHSLNSRIFKNIHSCIQVNPCSRKRNTIFSFSVHFQANVLIRVPTVRNGSRRHRTWKHIFVFIRVTNLISVRIIRVRPVLLNWCIWNCTRKHISRSKLFPPHRHPRSQLLQPHRAISILTRSSNEHHRCTSSRHTHTRFICCVECFTCTHGSHRHQ